MYMAVFNVTFETSDDSQRKRGYTCVLACKISPLFKIIWGGGGTPFGNETQEIFNFL